MEIVDRYTALGPPSDCKGPCEGTGFVPVFVSKKRIPKGRRAVFKLDETDPELRRRWDAAERVEPSKDGWHFVPCPTCKPGVTV